MKKIILRYIREGNDFGFISYTKATDNGCTLNVSCLSSFDGYEDLCIQDAILAGRFVNIRRK